jgi:glycosyltransferase involved in cell wall biosynthesis
MDKLSIVIAVYNESENIEQLSAQISAALEGSGIDYEVIYVNDGSDDCTSEVIKESAGNRTVLVDLKRNYGQTAALKAGIDISSGNYIATMDGDLQNDPGDLPHMLETLKSTGCDIVTGIREKRSDDLFLRKIPSVIANYVVRKVSKTDIVDNGCGIKIFKAQLLKDLPLYGERHRFIVSLAAMEGAIVKQVTVKHFPRIHGKSKYGLGRTIKVISDLILMDFFRKYEQKPMYLFGPAGILTALSGGVILLFLLYRKISGDDIWGRPILILGVLLLFTGFQIISTGLILDMIIRKKYEAKLISPYKIKNIWHAK